MSSENIFLGGENLDNTIPSPSPEAVMTIIEVMESLENGHLEMAVRLLEGCFRIVCPQMIALDKLRFLNNAIALGHKEVALPPHTMEFDWVHYADAAIKLNLVNQIDNQEMLEAIEVVRSSECSIDQSIELTSLYARFTAVRPKKS